MITATADPVSGYTPHDDVWGLVLPRPRINSFEWVCENVCMPDGRPFDPFAYPWTRGICQAWDDPRVETIYLQFAARLGKTAIGQALFVSELARKPTPALFGTSTEGLTKQTLKKKLLPILRETKATRRWVPEKTLSTRVDLVVGTVYGSWSGSVTTLADIDPRILHGNEIDKWSKDESEEGDPLDLFLERGAERPDRKVILESTPSITGVSRVNRGLVNGWNCRYQVPCPHCGGYQQLTINKTDVREEGGLWWPRPSGRHPTPDEAYAHAAYVCCHCHDEIYDHHKRRMNQHGIWVPEGMRVGSNGKLCGDRISDGPVASFQLARIYAPTFTFGDIARKYVESRGDLKSEQNFANSWEGETFNMRHTVGEWDEVARRLTTDTYKANELHEDVILVTIGCDVQSDHLVWEAVGWGERGRGFIIAFGTAMTWDELYDVIRTDWKHKLGGTERAVMTLIDHRHRQDEVHDFCRRHSAKGHWVWPIEGQRRGTMSGRAYRKVTFDDTKDSRGVGTGVPRLSLVKINTNEYQTWLDSALIRRRFNDPFSLCASADTVEDADFWSQLINEAFDVKSGVWVPVKEHDPWDFRDTTRYAKCAADVAINAAWNRLRPRPKHVEGVIRPDDPQPVPPPSQRPAAPHTSRTQAWKRRKMNRRG